MEHGDAIGLLRKALPKSDHPIAWADLGSGSGTFTKALAALLPDGSSVIAIDREPHEIISPNKNVIIRFIQANFQNIDPIPERLDGIIIANALHYVKDQVQFLTALKSRINENGRLIIVEYDTMQSNQWVPYPISYDRLQKIVAEAGFKSPQKTGERDSIYHNAKIYSSVVYPRTFSGRS